MIERVKRLGDFIVLIFIAVGFAWIFTQGSSVSDWDAEEWIAFGSMVWVFIRFALELKEYYTEKLIKEIEKEIEERLKK